MNNIRVNQLWSNYDPTNWPAHYKFSVFTLLYTISQLVYCSIILLLPCTARILWHCAKCLINEYAYL